MTVDFFVINDFIEQFNVEVHILIYLYREVKKTTHNISNIKKVIYICVLSDKQLLDIGTSSIHSLYFD